MSDKVLQCDCCGEPFLVSADDVRATGEVRYILCADCGEHLALELCRTQKE